MSRYKHCSAAFKLFLVIFKVLFKWATTIHMPILRVAKDF